MRPTNLSRRTSHPRQSESPAHTRLALSVIECAVRDVQGHNALLSRSAARFLNGSERFYFWTDMLEQDSNWLLRALRARLRKDSPQAFERLSHDALAPGQKGRAH
jgi:hypothetical protein